MSDPGTLAHDGAPLFLVDELPAGGTVLVTGHEARHAVDVLRMTAGERVRVADGEGTLVEGVVAAAGPDGCRSRCSPGTRCPRRRRSWCWCRRSQG